MLLASSLASFGTYHYFRNLNRQFIQDEVDHRSQLLLQNIREIINQHIDATEGMAAYIQSELAVHQDITQTDEAEELLRSTLAAHPDELAQATIFPPDSTREIMVAAPGTKAPPIRLADSPPCMPMRSSWTWWSPTE